MKKVSLKRISDEATDKVAGMIVETILLDYDLSACPGVYLEAYEILLEAGPRHLKSLIADRLMNYGLYDQAIELYEKMFPKSQGILSRIADEITCAFPSMTIEKIMGEYIAEYQEEGKHEQVVDLVEALQVSGYKMIVERLMREQKPITEEVLEEKLIGSN